MCVKYMITQHKVVMEQPYMFEHSAWFQPYVAAYYGVMQGLLPRTHDYFESLILVRREFVLQHLDYLLSFGQAMVPAVEAEIVQKVADKHRTILTVIEQAKAGER